MESMATPACSAVRRTSGFELGVSDRIVVYYFPTKDDLITEVLLLVGVRLQGVLATAFTEPAHDHIE